MRSSLLLGMTLNEKDLLQIALGAFSTLSQPNERRPIVVVVGSALSAPAVPGVTAVVDLIRQKLEPTLRYELDHRVQAARNPYQTAFEFLGRVQSQDAANAVIREAVRNAYCGVSRDEQALTLASGRRLEADLQNWRLTPGLLALGELAAKRSDAIPTVLTSNFDPLIEVCIRKSGGACWASLFSRDGGTDSATGNGCHIVHFHGYWCGVDTLHSPGQLTQDRPQLKADLVDIIGRHTLIVLGYGGWPDIFRAALAESFQTRPRKPDILWCFHEADAQTAVRQAPFLAELHQAHPERFRLVSGVDCHRFFPELCLRVLGPPDPPSHPFPWAIVSFAFLLLATTAFAFGYAWRAGKVTFERGDKSPLYGSTNTGRDLNIACQPEEVVVGLYGVAAEDKRYNSEGDHPLTFYKLGALCADLSVTGSGTDLFYLKTGRQRRSSVYAGKPLLPDGGELTLPDDIDGSFVLSCPPDQVMTQIATIGRKRNIPDPNSVQGKTTPEWTTYIGFECGRVVFHGSDVAIDTVGPVQEIGPTFNEKGMEFDCANGRSTGDGVVTEIRTRAGWNLDAVGVQCSRISYERALVGRVLVVVVTVLAAGLVVGGVTRALRRRRHG